MTSINHKPLFNLHNEQRALGQVQNMQRRLGEGEGTGMMKDEG